MLLGLYFMGWYRDMWNYHPSLPMKNMNMIDDIGEIGANTLIWSCLGSGAIGLPYLDREANESIPPRLRLYGFINDKEFCYECAKRGIEVFSVLWKSQLWEFGAEFNKDESELLSLNILRGASENKKYVGISELSTDKYPQIFDSMNKYFPGGLMDYKGNKVDDYLKEFKSVSLEGRDILSAWLMAPNHDHKCYSPCANKESYMTYMKKDVEMMSDAGAGGLHIDEYDTQKHVLQNAGCFCPECMDKFRDYLIENNIELPDDAGDINTFDYRKYLIDKGYKDKDLIAGNGRKRWNIPLFRHFTEMQMSGIEWVVKELSRHVKEYSLITRGKAMRVTANLFQCRPYSWSSKKYLDILAGEKTDIQLRQDGWYKFAFGWLNGKEPCFVEDPNQYVRDMIADIKDGINDRLILFLLEPLAHGFHIAFPYGSWLQNQVKDAFWPDLRVLKKLGQWLNDMESLFPKNPVADIAILYDTMSAYENMIVESEQEGLTEEMNFTEDGELGKQGAFASDGKFNVFFDLVQKMSDKNILYNVLYESPDEPLTKERLAPYKTVIIPDAFLLDDKFADIIAFYKNNGGKVITTARTVEKLSLYKNYKHEDIDRLVGELAADKGIITACDLENMGIAVHKNDKGYVLHIVNYGFNSNTHKIDPIDEAVFELGFDCNNVNVYSFPETNDISADLVNNKLILKNAGIYTVVEFK